MSKVSICVPTYEFNGRGAFYLQRLLDSLAIQTYKNFEVVISDQSCDNQIFNLLLWNSHDLQIKYFRCDKLPNENMSYNTNNAIKRATGDIIKPLFQDDLLNSPRVIERLMNEFENPDTNWVGLKYISMYDEGVEPRWKECDDPFFNPDTLYGHNKMSSPSAVAFRNTEDNVFDENVTMMMDCDFYHRMNQKYGLPRIVADDSYIAIGHNNDQCQKNMDLNEKITLEFVYLFQKHGIVSLDMEKTSSPWKPQMQRAFDMIKDGEK